MTEKIIFNETVITFYNCKDCGFVPRNSRTLRPNGKFCDRECMEYVLSKRKTKHEEYRDNHIKCTIKRKSFKRLMGFDYCPYCGEKL